MEKGFVEPVAQSAPLKKEAAKIVTTFVFPPIPDRSHDWSAVRDGYEPHDHIGYGATEADAVSDLKDRERLS